MWSLEKKTRKGLSNKKNNNNRHKGINVTLRFLEKAGIKVPMDYPRLPPWWWIEDQYGVEPVLLGLDRCHHFRMMNRNHMDQVHVAPVGLFNSGTNFLHQMLLENCRLPQQASPTAAASTASTLTNTSTNLNGRDFQPPWGKHTPREFRESHRIEHPHYQKMLLDAVLPIVLIRHPYDWLKSVCEQPYAVHWRDRDENRTIVCPWIVGRDNITTQHVIVTYGSGNIQYESVAHLWNRWNRGYYDSIAFPRLMVRMEDLIFYPHQVLPQICKCAGGTLLNADGNTKVSLESAKKNVPGHQQRLSTTFLQAVIKYGNLRTWERFPLRDHTAARAILDRELMETFEYKHPDIGVVMRNKARTGLE